MAKSVEELPLLASVAAADAVLATKPTISQRVHALGSTHIPPRMLGVVLVAASAFTFSLLTTLIKYASYSMPSMETVFWRSIVAWILNLIAVRVYNVDLRVERKDWPTLMTRCVAGFSSMAFGFYAMQQMVLADASVLMFTSPVMTFFLGALWLNEHIDRVNLGFAVFSFVGVICVSRPTFIFGESATDEAQAGSVFAPFCALIAAACASIAYVCMRSLKQLHFMVVINYFLLVSSVLSALSLLLIQRTFVIDLSIDTWLAVMGTGVLGFLGQLFLTRGFQLESAGTASVMRYLDVVFVFIWDTTLLHEHINLWSVVGAAVICGCAIMIAVRRMNHH